ncbi:MAG: PQQ-binding-like beta-propeller repeat protein [Steroidobacteraceae bacterium]
MAFRGLPGLLVVLGVCALTTGAAAPAPEAPLAGAQVYAKYCAACHEQVAPRIPTRDALSKLSPASILRALDFGQMMNIAYPMKREERTAVAAFLGKGKDEAALPASAWCKADSKVMPLPAAPNWTSWGPSQSNMRFQPTGPAGLEARDLDRLQLKWAFGFPGDVTAFAAPTVMDGSLFVGSAAGSVYALDANTGCVHWHYRAHGPVRAAMTIATEGAQRSLVFSDQNGLVYALDARTGKERWQKRVEQHEATRLTGSIAVHAGIAFVPAASWEETRSIDPAYECCTFRGSITAVRVRDGSVLWKTYLVDRPVKTGTMPNGTATFGPSGAGIWSAPTVDTARGLLYVATGDNYSLPATATSDAVVALSLQTGRVVWSQQTTTGDVFNSSCSRIEKCPFRNGPDVDFGSSAMLVRTTSGRDVVLAGQKSGVVFAFDPDNKGAPLWQARVGKGGANGGIQWGMASDGQAVYAAIAGSARARNAGPPGNVAGVIGNASFDPEVGGSLTALNVLDGTQRWFAPALPCRPPRAGCSPAQSMAVSAIPGAVFSGSMDGHLRAYSSADGKVLWDFDTVQTYRTVNGSTASGGSLDGAGPVIVGGMLYVNSGYPRFGGMPGNVLLAFGVSATQ